MDDHIILVDIFDRETGYASKAEAHRRGLLHRAFSVFILDDDRMLLQKRHSSKYHSGGLWSNACCSHPRKDEILEDAIDRRLEEELGITGVSCRELSNFVYRTKFAEDLYEYEYDHIYVGVYDGDVHFDPEEIEEVKWVDLDWLEEDLVNNPQDYTSWFLIAAPKVLEFYRE